MDIASNALQVVLGMLFILIGFIKFASPQMKEDFKRFQLSQSFRIVIGIVEIIAGFSLFGGLWNDTLALFGSAVIIIIMIGAIYTHLIKGKDPVSKIVTPAIFAIIALVVFLFS